MLNFGKCKCLHTGHRNLDVNYKMGDDVLGTTVKENDLGVTISADMKVSEQCGIAASKGNQILALIKRNITYKEKKLIIPLYKAIVRPHIEYCIQAWRPYCKKDIDTLERIQRRATKTIPELRDLSYEERLKECGLTTLETRWLRGDQIEVFKILNGYKNVDRNIFYIGPLPWITILLNLVTYVVISVTHGHIPFFINAVDIIFLLITYVVISVTQGHIPIFYQHR